jgi:hypothetical protein
MVGRNGVNKKITFIFTLYRFCRQRSKAARRRCCPTLLALPDFGDTARRKSSNRRYMPMNADPVPQNTPNQNQPLPVSVASENQNG